MCQRAISDHAENPCGLAGLHIGRDPWNFGHFRIEWGTNVGVYRADERSFKDHELADAAARVTFKMAPGPLMRA